MEIVVVAALALAGAILVALPIVRAVPGPVLDTRGDELNARKRAALEALVDLQAEHAIGKLSDDDYEQLQTTYQAEALTVLDEIEAAGDSAGDELEAEIAATRARLERET